MKYNVKKFHSLLAKAHLELGPNADTTALADKFAELLVLECAAVADKCIEDEWYDIGNAIKDHFGVKQ
jgi:hypothetical protein